MWEIITNHYDFENALVVDLGSGYGDMVRNVIGAGGVAFGIDHDPDVVEMARMRGAPTLCDEVLGWLANPELSLDAAFCFSVLPYLKRPSYLLEKMSKRAQVSFIECQYKGDGPGVVKDDAAMRLGLERYWDSVIKIGETSVKEGQFTRSIWMCQ